MQFSKPTLTVCVTGAAGYTAYNLVYLIASGEVFGHDQPVALRLLDIPLLQAKMEGVQMELQDCAFRLLKDVSTHTSPDAAFKNVDYAILLSAIPRSEDADPMLRCNNRLDVLRANTVIFKEHGLAFDRVAKPTTKVVVVANPSATNALIVSSFAKSVPKENFTSLAWLDQNRAAAHIAARLNEDKLESTVPLQHTGRDIRNLIVWGNHSDTMFPDTRQAVIVQPKPELPPVKLRAVLRDDGFLLKDLVDHVRQRGKAIVRKRQTTPAMSAARAVADHVCALHGGTREGETVSMGVYTNGNPYQVADGLFFSFPVKIKAGGEWHIVKNIQLDESQRDRIQASARELAAERHAAFILCGIALPEPASPVKESTEAASMDTGATAGATLEP
ncbi:uncharacterized protein MONBRDRAFT_39154 [Monosiga brevicollis MX1]|uniref:malate dehydrogenase n=1 Tax=Monosiga brevicollis TaxID=81824 RepID=A9VCK2_MONBE|nr:uncharacterized protein MONBRDRAFT_39154 [Monosiga brevicollis MX1]EDQ84763.1 predicted protein [Monosiga brevicollis MX1]|eukprot:XP_001750413.1 hypothetical protein [Monosiga brevicollis MX1]